MRKEEIMENEIKNEDALLGEAEEREVVEPTLPDGREAEDANATDATNASDRETGAPDYAAMAAEDLLEVRRLCPEFRELESLAELPSASRFGELRELGLSVSEALGALGLSGDRHDTRSHLRASVPKRLGDAGVRMMPSELEGARRLFPKLSEREITRLYRRVCK